MKKPMNHDDEITIHPIDLNDGRTVVLLCDHENYEIKAETFLGEAIGHFSFRFQECDSGDSLKLCYMDLSGFNGLYKNLGIGRKILYLALEQFQLPITAEQEDKKNSDDGSHLIGDGPGFIRTMKSEGLVEYTYGERVDIQDVPWCHD
jgi:hypothetical protein